MQNPPNFADELRQNQSFTRIIQKLASVANQTQFIIGKYFRAIERRICGDYARARALVHVINAKHIWLPTFAWIH